ncbi:hypothetical protein IHE45_15G052800 [Dioscorea alata]|uniref:Uncharacterized protein n=1 Tax=Dioscorea alata TaxID=55571 RepID=A0ACB7ULC9_DIOAL|nr:hypothetical protein IHE45_15G052800 [Dioscorea alata]
MEIHGEACIVFILQSGDNQVTTIPHTYSSSLLSTSFAWCEKRRKVGRKIIISTQPVFCFILLPFVLGVKSRKKEKK